MRLILVRHGETFYNAQRRLTGQSDVPLNPLGEQQAKALGDCLATEHLDVIVTSDLERTRVTARAIARIHKLPVQEDNDLRELAFGEWEGYTYNEVRVRDANQVSLWQDDPSTYAPPGGETVAQLRDRCVRALKRWQAQYPESSVLWVTHGGLIGVLMCHVLDIDLKRRWQFNHDNASISELHFRGDRVIIARLNETAHIRALQMEAE
ncbi:MAG TPA: alpha-ribazole phosphatase [Ktedonobacteraceae bacterium]|nr:alpha-ribazole phosphatase [Ktedonobacteraceae bacterium]